MKDNPIDMAIEALEIIFNEVDDGTLIESYAEEYQTIRKALEAHVSQPKDSAVMRDLAEALEKYENGACGLFSQKQALAEYKKLTKEGE